MTGLAGCAGRATVDETAQPVRVVTEAAAEPTVPSDGLSAEFHARFGLADARARAMSYWLQCVPTLARLRAEGRFGSAARAPRLFHCARTADGVPIGGVFDIDSSFRTVRRLTVVRLDGARAAYADPLDTLAIAREARLARDVQKVVSASWAKQRRPFSVIPVTRDSGRVVEVWVLPRATRARTIVTGGEMGYGLGPDGAPSVIVDRRATWKEIALPSTGPLRLASAGADVAAEADLATARFQAALGRQVTVTTAASTSVLEAGFDPTTGARLVWKHTPIPAPRR